MTPVSGSAERRGADARRLDAEDVAQPAGAHEFAQLRDRGIEALDMADHELAPRIARGGAHTQRIGQRRRDRLLDEHVEPALERGEGDLGVQRGRAGDRDGVERGRPRSRAARASRRTRARRSLRAARACAPPARGRRRRRDGRPPCAGRSSRGARPCAPVPITPTPHDVAHAATRLALEQRDHGVGDVIRGVAVAEERRPLRAAGRARAPRRRVRAAPRRACSSRSRRSPSTRSPRAASRSGRPRSRPRAGRRRNP